jgi:hypothetical protein
MLKGSLYDSGANKATQAQSQLYFGSILAHAGMRPVVPSTATSLKSPDFVATIGGLRVAVEVKRPNIAKSLRDAITEGSKQCIGKFAQHGILAIDFSDLILPALPANEDAAREMLRYQFQLAFEFIHEAKAPSAISRVISLVGILRYIALPRKDRFMIGAMFHGAAFALGVRSLVIDQSRHFLSLLESGLRSSGADLHYSGR